MADKTNPKSLNNLKPFEKGNDSRRNMNGAPRKLVSGVIEKLNLAGVGTLKPSQIINAYETLLNMTIPEIEAIYKDKNQPVFMRIVTKALLSSKGIDAIELMLNRAHGRSKQSVEVKADIAIDDIDYTKLSDSALKEIIRARTA